MARREIVDHATPCDPYSGQTTTNWDPQELTEHWQINYTYSTLPQASQPGATDLFQKSSLTPPNLYKRGNWLKNHIGCGHKTMLLNKVALLIMRCDELATATAVTGNVNYVSGIQHLAYELNASSEFINFQLPGVVSRNESNLLANCPI
ncbi:hypothetical protein CBL_10359 [Carabus blaptoides fortunei]